MKRKQILVTQYIKIWIVKLTDIHKFQHKFKRLVVITIHRNI